MSSRKFKLTVFIYGLLLAGLLSVMKYLEYRYFIRELSVETYVAAVAILFTSLGIWVGLKIIRRKKQSYSPTQIDSEMIKKLRISEREYEVLEHIAMGLSNQEIADKLFLSVPTIKTHSSKLFEKLHVQRRTQAVQKAKELQIIQ